MAAHPGRTGRDKPRAFTLIELLVVIAIIAVLLSVLMPAMRKIKEIARETACRSNQKNIGLAVIMYLEDNELTLPPRKSDNGFLWRDDQDRWRRVGSNGSYWGLWYKDYIKGQTKIFGCPSLRRVPEGLIYNVPDPAKAIQHAAFGQNSHPRARHRNTTDVYRASEFIICVDHAEPRNEASRGDGLHNDDTPGQMNLTQYRSGGRARQYRQIFRHNIRYPDPDRTGGRLNILWLDGHVSSLEETTGDDVYKRWYTGDKPEPGGR